MDLPKRIHPNPIIEDEAEKASIIMSFSNKLMEYTVDLDNDIVDMVNENFWDLL